MILQPFRKYHLSAFFDEYERSSLPLDFALNRYFRQHQSLGSKDRGYVAENVYTLMRWKGLLASIILGPFSWEEALDLLEKRGIEALLREHELPANVEVSFPENLYERIIESHGVEKGNAICKASNTPAPVTLRANLMKTTRKDLLNRLNSSGFPVQPCQNSSVGIQAERRMNFFSLPEFKLGMFELQDEGSQLLAQLVAAKPGEQVMDYCAGSGGKTLALAPAMENKGQIFLHDVRKHILDEARKRLRRAGIQNAQVVSEGDPKLKKLKKKMDWVLVDAPCSGTGTLRRNPDMKWKFDAETLPRLVGQQRMIFEKALSFLKPSGTIVYATCSILQSENQEQVDHFLKTYNLEVVDEPFISVPTIGGMDGFFGVQLKKK